jgi:hypothetical protein
VASQKAASSLSVAISDTSIAWPGLPMYTDKL